MALKAKHFHQLVLAAGAAAVGRLCGLVADCDFLARVDVADGVDVLGAGGRVPRVVRVRRAAVVEARARQEETKLGRVRAKGERVCAHDAVEGARLADEGVVQGEEAALVVFRHCAQLRRHVRDDVGQTGGSEVGDAEERLLGQDTRAAGNVGPGNQALPAPRHQHNFVHRIRHGEIFIE